MGRKTSNKNVEIDNSIFENLKPLPKKVYFGFHTRILFNCLISSVLLLAAAILLLSSFSIVKLDAIKYKDTGGVDYKVYLKENDFFGEYLKKGAVDSFVASLIKNIDADFTYHFEIDRDSKMDVEYKVIGKLSITSAKDNSLFFEKEYNLVESTKDTFDGKNYTLNKNVVIDYDYYNTLANKFKYNYGVDSNSNLTVTLIVNENSNQENTYAVSNTGTISLNIPLSEKDVKVNINDQGVSKKQEISVGRKRIINRRKRFVAGLASAFIALFFICRLIRLLLKSNVKKSKYDLFVSKILKEYDRLIVNTRTAPNLDDYNVIKIDTFEELLDARDNVKGAIKYFVVNSHQKCMFYFLHDHDMYLLTIKAVDLEKKEKSNKEL